MAENYTLLDLAEEVLRQSDRPLSTFEIWKKADKLGLPDKLTKKKRRQNSVEHYWRKNLW